jgi:Xaa-Pro aminopeptidase
MSALEQFDHDALSETLRQRGLDGWLIYDFHDLNPLARRMLGETGMLTRRIFIWLPAVGEAHLVISRIDRPSIGEFPGKVDEYTTWQELHQHLGTLVRGRRVAMETSPENAVPYLDLVPSGVVELLTRLGATLAQSAPLVTAVASRWSPAELDDHRQTAETIADIARTVLAETVKQVGAATEVGVQRRVLEALDRKKLVRDEDPIVAFGAHAADPHYEPKESTDRALQEGETVLLDLWAQKTPSSIWADQTWMGFSGSAPPEDVLHVWNSVVGARDAVVQRLTDATQAGERVSGAALDQVARNVIASAGYAEWFGHRTGHSIDLGLHGSGPHLDDYETHDTRELLPEIGFSVEPGVYLPGRFGVRTEINIVLHADGPEVTPAEIQRELIRPT